MGPVECCLVVFVADGEVGTVVEENLNDVGKIELGSRVEWCSVSKKETPYWLAWLMEAPLSRSAVTAVGRLFSAA